jgi:hypothetical protein
LDVVEDETVVAGAIAKMGGPSVYRLVPVDPLVCLFGEDEEEGRGTVFKHCPGTSTWVVPHPEFKADNQVVYERFEDVPELLQRKKTIVEGAFAAQRYNAE